MQKLRSYAEVHNDLDGEIVNLLRVLQDRDSRAELVEHLVFTPYSREEFEFSWEPSAEPIERARRTIIRAQMGFGSAGATEGITGFRIDTKRQYGTAQSLTQQVHMCGNSVSPPPMAALARANDPWRAIELQAAAA